MSFDPGGGGIANADDVALNNPSRGQVLTYLSSIGKWKNVSFSTTVKHFGAKGDGVADDTVAIQSAINAMVSGGSLYFPEGTYLVSETIQLPTVDGASLIGPIGSQLRLPPAVIRAAPGSNLLAIAATREWLTNGLSPKDPVGIVIQGLGFDGGGFRSGDDHKHELETTSNTQDGLVMHGTGWTLDRIFVLSTNRDGILIPRFGVDGVSGLTGSHENFVFGGSARYSGRDNFHAADSQQDAWVEMFRPSFAGRHNINIESSAGWTFMNCHPTFGAQDIFHCTGAWPITLIGNYISTVGEYLDDTGIPGVHYGMNINGAAIIQGNKFHFSPNIDSFDPTAGLRLKDGPIIYAYNSVYIGSTSNAYESDMINIGSDSFIGPNIVREGAPTEGEAGQTA